VRKELAARTLNLGLRSLAMGSRFVLLIVLAKLLEPADIGLFGLIVATISFSMLMIGGDYYAYSQRELLSLPREHWSFVLQHQALATGMLYLILVPAQLIIFWLELLPYQFMPWFFALLIAEHIGQEINRLLVAMHRPVVASAVLFVRLGAWVWVLLPIMWLRPQLVDLDAVFQAWLVGAMAAIVIGVAVVLREAMPWQRWPVDWAWLRRGFSVGLMFLFATICFKALFTADRYLVEYLAGLDWLGVYVLYVGIALTAANFIDPAVFSFLYPRMVSAFRQGDMEAYQKYLREMAWSAIGFSVLLAAGIISIAPLVLEWLGRAIYLEHMPVLWVLLAVAVVYSAGMVPHYGLYAKGADRSIVIAHVSSLLIFAFSTYLFSQLTLHYAVPLGLLAAFSWMGVFKLLAYRRAIGIATTPVLNGGIACP
jgi:O-antigen/teichoic acid export membrane protein